MFTATAFRKTDAKAVRGFRPFN